jgi:protein-disulfide isomerase
VASKKGASRKASSKSFGGILAVVAIIGVATIGYVISRPVKVVTLPVDVAEATPSAIVRGDSNAPVTVIEFADFECPGCGQFALVTEPDVMSRLVDMGEVQFRFMDFPLDIHPNAPAAHNAAHCANEQGRFWEMHDAIFRNQNRWSTLTTRNPKKVLEGIAETVGLDMRQWNDCFDSGRMLPQIAANRAEAVRLRVGSTPTFIINGRMIQLNRIPTYDDIRQLVTQAKIEKMAAESEATGKAATSPTKTP